MVEWRCNKIELAHQGKAIADVVFNAGQKGHHIVYMDIGTLCFRIRKEYDPRVKIQNERRNPILIRASALLHDITKTRSFNTNENHAETGGEFLRERGFTEVGHVIAQHVKLDAYVVTGSPVEAEIVNYADKRVLHDRIVLLTDRLAYILERYGDGMENREKILGLWGKSKELEKKIFSCLPFLPEELKGVVKANRNAGFQESNKIYLT